MNFNWPQEVKEAMGEHIQKATSRLDPARYAEESEYVTALLARLDGLVFQNKHLHVEVISTIVADPGPHAIESVFGADFVVTASLQTGKQKIQKAVLGQANRGPIDDLTTEQKNIFNEQSKKMLEKSRHCIALETPLEYGQFPLVKILGSETSIPIKEKVHLTEYLNGLFLGCLHGDTRGFFVRDVSETHLSELHISAHTIDDFD